MWDRWHKGFFNPHAPAAIQRGAAERLGGPSPKHIPQIGNLRPLLWHVEAAQPMNFSAAYPEDPALDGGKSSPGSSLRSEAEDGGHWDRSESSCSPSGAGRRGDDSNLDVVPPMHSSASPTRSSAPPIHNSGMTSTTSESEEGVPSSNSHGGQGDRIDESERELIQRARVDRDAFETLYRRHYPAIQRYLRRRLGDSHLVEDAVAETFIAAFEQLHRFRFRGVPFRAWLYRIATGRAHRHFRKAARSAERQLEFEPAQIEAEASASVDLVRLALLRLPARFQDVLVLHHIEGLAVEEVALALNCRPGTVKSRLFRARKALGLLIEGLEVKA